VYVMLTKSQELGALYNELIHYVPRLSMCDKPYGILNYYQDYKPGPELVNWFIYLSADSVDHHEPCPYYEAIIVQNCLELLPYCFWFTDTTWKPLQYVIRQTDIEGGIRVLSTGHYLSIALLRAVAVAHDLKFEI